MSFVSRISFLRQQFLGKITFRLGLLNDQLSPQLLHTLTCVYGVTQRKEYGKVFPELSSKRKKDYQQKITSISSKCEVQKCEEKGSWPYLISRSHPEKMLYLEVYEVKLFNLRFITQPCFLNSVHKILSYKNLFFGSRFFITLYYILSDFLWPIKLAWTGIEPT